MRRLAWVLLAGSGLHCGSRPAGPSPSPAPSLATSSPAPPAPAAPPTPPPAESVLLVTDREALAVVERGPGAFATLIGAGYDTLVKVLGEDLDRVQRSDKLAGISVARHAHRLLDRRWLTAPEARFGLVAVSNRLDRRPFHARACGEIRLVYRLGYDAERGGQALSSRLPITLSVELSAEHDDQGSCRVAATRWQAPPGLAGAALGDWLIGADGPLGGGRVSALAIARVNVNVQSVRWPSTVRPDLGGHAEYVLRTFVPEGAGLRSAELENTPDVARLKGAAAERRELLEWLRQPEQLAAIDRGTALVPARFLAKEAISVTPHGLARRKNRPFRQLFSARDFADLPLERYATIRSPEALIRRLDGLSCPGCHQSRSLAGFHLLGDDAPNTAAGNALAVAISPHLGGELARRRRLADATVRGEAADFSAPFPERAAGDRGEYGAHCGLGDQGFAGWTCAEGLVCQPYGIEQGEPPTVGTCLPAVAGAGDPCEPTALVPHDDARRDRVSGASPQACGAGAATCNRSKVGFPGGMCTASCSALPDEAACGAIAVLTSFNDCLARNQPFAGCISQHSTPAGLRRCSADSPCRDDYLCARTPSDEGVCIPPYFLFQLRVDGHPSP